MPFNAMLSICQGTWCVSNVSEDVFGHGASLGWKKEACWSLKGQPQLSALAFWTNFFPKRFQHVKFHFWRKLLNARLVGRANLVWRLPECWCWQMWQLRGPILGGWKGGRMRWPFGVPPRYTTDLWRMAENWNRPDHYDTPRCRFS